MKLEDRSRDMEHAWNNEKTVEIDYNITSSI